MIESDAQTIFGAKLTGFHFAPRRIVHLSFTQYHREQLIARPERLYTQIWLVRPKRVVFKMTKQDRILLNVTFENSLKGIISTWLFSDDEMLSVECQSISHVFLPVVAWIT